MRNELAKEQEEVNQQIQAECLQVIAKFHMAYQEALGNRRSQGLTAEETIEVNRVAAQVDHTIRQFKQQLISRCNWTSTFPLLNWPCSTPIRSNPRRRR